jgi:protein tyrosine/serine phosphatase
MKRRSLILLLALPVAFWVVGRATLGEDVAVSHATISRFQQVAPGLYRGGQPSAPGFEFLKRKGVKTVINLRKEHDEKELVERLGMNYVHIPVDARETISEQTIKRFFAVVNDPAYQPVFVHCERGADRTGVMVGFYRIAVQGWDGSRAYDEARDIGMRWWHRGLKRQLYEFAARPSASRSRSPLPAGGRKVRSLKRAEDAGQDSARCTPSHRESFLEG